MLFRSENLGKGFLIFDRNTRLHLARRSIFAKYTFSDVGAQRNAAGQVFEFCQFFFVQTQCNARGRFFAYRQFGRSGFIRLSNRNSVLLDAKSAPGLGLGKLTFSAFKCLFQSANSSKMAFEVSSSRCAIPLGMVTSSKSEFELCSNGCTIQFPSVEIPPR